MAGKKNVAIVAAATIVAVALGGAVGYRFGQGSISVDPVASLAAYNANAPQVKAVRAAESPVAGLVEIGFDGGASAFVDPTGRYVIAGILLDAKKQVIASKLIQMGEYVQGAPYATQSAQKNAPQAANAAASSGSNEMRTPDRLPIEQLVGVQGLITVEGPENRTLTVFSDPTCTHCRTLEKTLEGLTGQGVRVRVIPYPVREASIPIILAIWCSASDQQVALWKRALAGDVSFVSQVPATDACTAKVRATIDVGSAWFIRSTPTMILPNGTVLSGAQDIAAIRAAMSQ